MSWIKLNHKLKNWGWADEPSMVALWIRILLEANIFPQEWHGEMYEEGTFPTSIDKLATSTGLSKRTVRTGLDRLKKSGQIAIQSTNKGSKISIVKWADYQGSVNDDDKPNAKRKGRQPTSNRQSTDNQPTTIIDSIDSKESKEYIYYGEYKNVKLSAEQMEKLKAEFPTDYKERIEKVSLYCASTGKKYKDYLATIRNWARKDPVRQEDTVPVYSTSNNKEMSSADEEELMRLMKGEK